MSSVLANTNDDKLLVMRSFFTIISTITFFFAFTKLAAAQTLTVSSNYPWPVPFNDPPVTCDFPIVTFTGTNLSPAQNYFLCEECVDCTTAGLPKVIYSHLFPTSSFTFNRSYNPDNVCGNGGAVVEPGLYFATLYFNNDCTGKVDTDRFYYVLANTCTLDPQYPIVPQPGSGNIVLTNNNPYLVDYNINIFPAGACTYPNTITVAANSSQPIQVSCTSTNGTPHQMSLISNDMNNYPDLCGAIFTVDNTTSQACTGETTGFYPGACVPETPGCISPTNPDGQAECSTGEVCCVFGDTVPPPTSSCTSVNGNEGVCGFVMCPEGSRMEYDGPPPDKECPTFYGCCVPLASSINDDILANTNILCANGGISTAIGCIQFTNLNDFSLFWLKFAIGLSGGVATLLLVFGGIIIATSAGNPQSIMSGKDLVIAAISGLIMILFSVYLLEIIGIRILNLPGL